MICSPWRYVITTRENIQTCAHLFFHASLPRDPSRVAKPQYKLLPSLPPSFSDVRKILVSS
jgi:hypothetical protein